MISYIKYWLCYNKKFSWKKKNNYRIFLNIDDTITITDLHHHIFIFINNCLTRNRRAWKILCLCFLTKDRQLIFIKNYHCMHTCCESIPQILHKYIFINQMLQKILLYTNQLWSYFAYKKYSVQTRMHTIT